MTGFKYLQYTLYKVARIGKDVLSTYIVNGEFLKEKLESDLAAYVAEDNSRENLDDAIDAYYEFIANETAKQLYEHWMLFLY